MKGHLPKKIAPLLIVGMEGCWMASTLWLLEAWLAPEPFPAAWLISGVPLALTLSRLTQASSRLLRATVGLAGGVFWVLFMTGLFASPEGSLADPTWWKTTLASLFGGQGGPNKVQMTLVIAAAVWAAGLRLAVVQVAFDQILSEFQLGVLILLCVFLFAAQLEIRLPAMTPAVLIFFVLFLLGIAAARRADVSGWLERSGRVYWFAAFLFNSGLVLGAGLLLTSSVTPGALGLILGFLETVWDTLTDWLVRFIAFLARMIPQPEIKSVPIGGGAGLSPPHSQRLPDLLSIPDYVRRIAAFLVSVFWVLLFGICLWRIASQIAGWLRRQMNDMDRAEIETLPGSFRQDLLRLLRYIRQRMAGWMAWIGYVIGRKHESRPEPAESAAVRRLYRALLAWSAAGGCARMHHQTPNEFLGRLGEWLPPARAELTMITKNYSAVRYGNRQSETECIKTLERAWQDVRKMRNRSKIRQRWDALRKRRTH